MFKLNLIPNFFTSKAISKYQIKKYKKNTSLVEEEIKSRLQKIDQKILETSKEIFESQLKVKGLEAHAGLKELNEHLRNYPHSNPELIFQILLGNHYMTGLEMTIAYRHGSCPMRSALNDWINDPLEKLNEAFLEAVITKSLA